LWKGGGSGKGGRRGDDRWLLTGKKTRELTPATKGERAARGKEGEVEVWE